MPNKKCLLVIIQSALGEIKWRKLNESLRKEMSRKLGNTQGLQGLVRTKQLVTLWVSKKSFLISSFKQRSPGRLNDGPPKCPCASHQDCYLIWQTGLCRCDEVKHLEIGVVIMDYQGRSSVIMASL